VLIEPDFQQFQEVYNSGRSQLIWADLVADLMTPVGAFLRLAEDRANSFLFESISFSDGTEVRGRYSIIGLKPDLIWRCRGDKSEINRRALFDQNAFEPINKEPLAALRDLVDESSIDMPPGLPPMGAGLFGYLGYDMVRLMEKLPGVNPDPLGLPDSVLVRPSVVAVFDVVRDVLTIITPIRPEPGVSARAAYARAGERLSDIVADLDRSLPQDAGNEDAIETLPAPTSNTTHDEYLEIVERAKEYVRAGDVFQVVPSQRFSVPFNLPPLALYRALRRVNPSPYMFFLNYGDFAVVGSSPETLVRLEDETVTIRPLAGTRPRGETPKEDQDLADELLSDPKELAEHLMLLDLGRNDTGRVSKIGSVNVTDSFFVQHFSHVMHIISNVEGALDPKYDALSALVAGFPAGTVSGAPKVRAMEIIDELEKEKRGIYAGAVGYFSANGSMDNCIALRTAVVTNQTLYVQAGGGIVADSVPESEYTETVNKAKAIFRAADEAVKYASTTRRSQ
jgi:anthranilate synthase component 1